MFIITVQGLSSLLSWRAYLFESWICDWTYSYLDQTNTLAFTCGGIFYCL